MKRGILLVAYGAGNMRGTAALRSVQVAAEERFGLPVRWAYTSEPMRLRLAKSRTKSDSVFKALSRMRFERYTHVAVQPLHLIPGDEFAAVAEDCTAVMAESEAAGAPFRVSIGLPMLASGADDFFEGLPEACSSAPCATPTCPDPVGRTAATLISHISPLRSPDEPVIYMAHGSRHQNERLFRRLAEAVRALDPLVHVACMIGPNTPRGVDLDDPAWPDGLSLLMPSLQELFPASHRIWLLPMLSLVGRHTLEDMAGAGPESWKSRIEAAGWCCQPELRGLADDPAFIELWLDRLNEALAALDAPAPQAAPCSTPRTAPCAEQSIAFEAPPEV